MALTRQSEDKSNKNKFFLVPSLIIQLPDHWQDNSTGADNLKCLTLYRSEGDLNLLRKRSGRDEKSISVAVRKAVDTYLQKKSWGVNMLPQSALKRKSCTQLSVYPFEQQINKLKYLSSQTNRCIIDLVTEAISKYCS
jgi:hypothetical protein